VRSRSNVKQLARDKGLEVFEAIDVVFAVDDAFFVEFSFALFSLA
jgi:hypothetical protein